MRVGDMRTVLISLRIACLGVIGLAITGQAPVMAQVEAVSIGVMGSQISLSKNVMVMVREDRRHQPHLLKPNVLQPQYPTESTEKNVGTGKPINEWQHFTDDWFGARLWVDDHGVVFEASVTVDTSVNFQGGQNTAGTAFGYLFDANLTLDTQRLGGWEGGVLFLDFQNQTSDDGSEDVGDSQVFSNIDAGGRTEIAELWYEQILLDGKVRIKVGRVAANSEYAFVDHGGEFGNSSMGFSLAVFVLPTYPDPAMSINVLFYPQEWLYAGLGIFDGSEQEGVLTGSRGAKIFFASPADLFVIGEPRVMWVAGSRELGRRLGLGGWGHHTGTINQFDGGVEDGTAGFYLVSDQEVWHENVKAQEDEQGIGLFFQYGNADPDISEVQSHFGAGLVWTGAIPTRDEDVVGIGLSKVWFTDEPQSGLINDTEVALELFYKVQLFPWATIKPDLQYIANPGGEGLADAVVGTVHIEVLF